MSQPRLGRVSRVMARADVLAVCIAASVEIGGALLGSPVALAEATPKDGSVYSVPEVLVTAPRPVTVAGAASAVTTSVDSLDIPAAPTFEDVLRELPLLHVRSNSRGEAELSARGSESRQVAVLIDGIPITLAWDARADVSVIPATALRNVTFIRGPASLLYGPNVLGGVVEVDIAQVFAPPAMPSTELTLGADHLGAVASTVTTSLPLGTPTGRWFIRGGVGYRNSPGDPRARNVTEPVPTDGDLRLNTDARNIDGFAALGHRSRAGRWFSLSGTTFRAERGIAAELGVPDADARLWRYPHVSRTVAVLAGGTGFRVSPFGGHADLRVRAGLDRGRTRIDAFTSRRYDELAGFENGNDRTLTFRLQGTHTLGPRAELRAAFTFADIHHDEAIPEGDFEYQQRLWSTGMEAVWRLVESKRVLQTLALSAGGAYDGAETPKTGGREALDPVSEWGGRAGLTAVLAGGKTILHVGLGRRGRFPALRELYSGALNRFVPNPDLQPEKLLTTEAGVTTYLGGADLQAVVFHNRLRDAVTRITLEDGRFMRVNRKELTSTGLELVVARTLGGIAASASATVQTAEMTDTETREASRPENLPETFGELRVRFPLPAGFEGSAGVAYTGTQFGIDPVTAEDTRLGASAIVSGYLSRTWRLSLGGPAGGFSRVEARVRVANAGDAVAYAACRLPDPGRRVRVELRFF